MSHRSVRTNQPNSGKNTKRTWKPGAGQGLLDAVKDGYPVHCVGTTADTLLTGRLGATLGGWNAHWGLITPRGRLLFGLLESFTGKAPPPQKRPVFRMSKRKWTLVLAGPCSSPRTGYFPVASSQYHAAWPARLAAFLLGQAAGPLEGLTADAAVQAAAAGRSPPAGLRFGHRSEIAALYDRASSQELSIVTCDVYFAVPKAEVRAIRLAIGGLMEIETAGSPISVNGADPAETVKGYLSLWGYPVALDPYNPRVMGKFAFGLILAAAGVIGVILEFAELKGMIQLAFESTWLKEKIYRDDGTPSPVFGAAVMGVVIAMMAVFYGKARKYHK